jgi:GDPmannose 4,6-dehydratase
VATDPRYLRPTEVDFLQGDPCKAHRLLGWEPNIDFEELVFSMVQNDLELARQEQTLIRGGHKVVQRANVTYA